MIKYYLSNSASRTIIGEKVSEFKTSKLFSIAFNKKQDCLEINYTLFNHITEGNAIIHRWIEQMDEFQNKLVLKYDYFSKSISLENHHDLKNKWNSDFKNKLKQEFVFQGVNEMINETEKVLNSKLQYEKQFGGYSLFRCFFNPIYQNNFDNQELDLIKYLGTSDLNIITQTQVLENNSFVNTARVNETKIDINKTIRELTHSFSIKPDLQVDMEEIYQLDNNDLPIKVDLFLDTIIIDGFYSIVVAHQILEVSEQDFYLVAEKFNNENLEQCPFTID